MWECTALRLVGCRILGKAIGADTMLKSSLELSLLMWN